MNDVDFIIKSLSLQGLPVYQEDISSIQKLLFTINQAENSLNAFPHLNKEVPITIVDKELML